MVGSIGLNSGKLRTVATSPIGVSPLRLATLTGNMRDLPRSLNSIAMIRIAEDPMESAYANGLPSWVTDIPKSGYVRTPDSKVGDVLFTGRWVNLLKKEHRAEEKGPWTRFHIQDTWRYAFTLLESFSAQGREALLYGHPAVTSRTLASMRDLFFYMGLPNWQ